MNAARALADQGWTTAEKMAASTWEQRARVLNEAGYARYDERTASMQEPAEALHGVNALGNVGYDGPLGTVNRTFRSRFRLYALDQPLDLQPGADKSAFERAIDGHVLDQAELTVRYERPR